MERGVAAGCVSGYLYEVSGQPVAGSNGLPVGAGGNPNGGQPDQGMQVVGNNHAGNMQIRGPNPIQQQVMSFFQHIKSTSIKSYKTTL